MCNYARFAFTSATRMMRHLPDGQKQIPRPAKPSGTQTARRLKSGSEKSSGAQKARLTRNDNARMLKGKGLGTGTRHGARGAEEGSFVRCGGLRMTAKGEKHRQDRLCHAALSLLRQDRAAPPEQGQSIGDSKA